MRRKSKAPVVYTAGRTGKTMKVLGVCALIGLSGIAGFAGGYAGSRMTAAAPSAQASTIQSVADTTQTDDLSGVAAQCAKSVVEITTESVTDGGRMIGQYVQEGAGSGVILSEDGYIITNDHVVSGASSIKVRTQDGNEFDAQLVGTDPISDIAVLKVDGQGMTAAAIGSSDPLSVGETVIAIGNPLGSLGGTVTTGILSALDREIEVNGETMTLLQTDAAVNPGNSGGGLFDSSGALIGIVNAKTSSEGIEGLGFAIPADVALGVAQQLMENGAVTNRAAMNVSLADTGQGVAVVQVVEGGAAAKAGLQPGDRILSIDKEEVSSVSDVKKIVRSHAPDDRIEVTVMRNGSVHVLHITLGAAG